MLQVHMLWTSWTMHRIEKIRKYIEEKQLTNLLQCTTCFHQLHTSQSFAKECKTSWKLLGGLRSANHTAHCLLAHFFQEGKELSKLRDIEQRLAPLVTSLCWVEMGVRPVESNTLKILEPVGAFWTICWVAYWFTFCTDLVICFYLMDSTHSPFFLCKFDNIYVYIYTHYIYLYILCGFCAFTLYFLVCCTRAYFCLYGLQVFM